MGNRLPPLQAMTLVFVLCVALPAAARQASVGRIFTWSGSTGDARWSNPANWSGGVVPGPSDVARFNALSSDVVLDAASSGVVSGIVMEESYPGTLRLERDLAVTGEFILAGGRFEQRRHRLATFGLRQTGGTFVGGTGPFWVDGEAAVLGGLLETPGNVMRIWALEVRAPGIVRVGRNGRLELAGDGSPLTGDGLLDTTTYRPTSVEYTGHATSDLISAGPARAFRQLGSGGQKISAVLRRRMTRTGGALRTREPLAFGDPEAVLTLHGGENSFSSAVIDTTSGFAYFGTYTSPGIVVKVRLSDFTRVGALTLNADENALISAVIDPAAGFAYFGTYASPGIVVKVRLSDLTRVDSLTLNTGENSLSSAVIDTGGGFAYFGTSPTWPDPGIVVKVRLSDFTRVGSLTFNSGESLLTCAVIDTAAGFAYFGTYEYPSYVVKVRLSDFTRVGSLALNSVAYYLASAVIDPAGGFAYFGTDMSPARVVKLRLSDFTLVSSLTLSEGYADSAVIDPAGGFVYFGIGLSPVYVAKVQLSDFTEVGTLMAGVNNFFLISAVIDPASGMAYFGTDDAPGIIVKVRLSDFTKVGALTPSDGENYLDAAVIDSTGGFAYFGTGNPPGVVVKIRLSDFTRVGALTLNSGEDYLVSAAIDAAGGFAYFGTATYPGIVIKVRLSDFTRAGALTLNPGEDLLKCAVIDPADGFAYFGTFSLASSPGIVVKVRLSDFTRVGSLTLNSGEVGLWSAVIDPGGGFAYFGTDGGSATVVKVRLSDFSRVGALTLSPAADSLPSAVIDPAGGFAYFGTNSNRIVARVRLSDFTQVDALVLNNGENHVTTAVIDPARGFAYFGCNYYSIPHPPATVVKVRLSDFSRVGALTLSSDSYGLSSAVIDTVNNLVYFGTATSPGKVVRVDVSTGGVATAAVTGGGSICQGGSTIIQAYLTGMAPWSITWSDNVTQTGILTSPAMRGVSPAATTTYTVTAVSDANGPGASSGSATVTVNPVPVLPYITAPAAVLPAATGVTASVVSNPGSVYAWTVTNGSLTSGQGTSQITFTAGTSGVVSLMVRETSEAGCISPEANRDILIGVASPAGLVEDAHATAGTLSNVNLVLEPGETALINPYWTNISASSLALTGTASFVGDPFNPAYTLLDTNANYGTIAPGATTDSFSAGGPSYRLSVSNPATRSAAHWDVSFVETLSSSEQKTWTLHIGQSFSDVSVSNGAYRFVETLLHNGITAGCGGGNYCPASNVNRWQMAVFLATAMVGPTGTVPMNGTVPSVGSYDCTSGGNSLFNDVPPTDGGCKFIHYIYAQGLTGGCGGGNYCPAGNVTRWQMAVFLATAMAGSGAAVPVSGTVSGVGSYNCTSGGNSLFGDVSPTDPGCRFIHYIYAGGVTAGCGGGNYCPASVVTRWQMAVFLVTAFHIPFL